MSHHHHAYHRPNVRRLPKSLGIYRWKAECPCGYWTARTFWRAALIAALLHSEVKR